MAQIYIETHGCQMNEADSQDIQRRAVSAGFTLAERPEDAAVLVLNTCTVRDNAEKRAYGRIGHWKAIKNADQSVKVIVTGCLAEQDKGRMQQTMPHIDGVFGTSELGALGDALAAWRAEYPDDDFSVDREIETVMGGAGEGIAGPYDGLRGFVTVQRGCSYYCTFCIVPHVRGRFDHRPMRDILADVRDEGGGRRARDHAGRPDGERVQGAGDRRRLRRPHRRGVRDRVGRARRASSARTPRTSTRSSRACARRCRR